MKRMVSESKGFLWSIVFLAVAALSIVGCGGGGGGGGGGTSGATTTTISGKVALSSTVGGSSSLKARPKAMLPPVMANAKGRPFGKAMKGSPSSPGNRLGKAIQRAASQAPSYIANATVSLYDADHSEWLYPVSKVTTDADGAFTLSTKNMNPETGAADTSGATIPSGNYTLIAIGKDSSTSAVTTATYPYYDTDSGKAYRNIVGVQAVVQKYEGAVTGNDLTVQSSDATPSVVSIMGKKTSDLTTTSGGEYDLGSIASNKAIQVIFDMSMHRANTPNAITLKDSGGTAVSGSWKMSPDLTAATFYPTSTLTESATYNLTISSTGTANYYGKGLKADVKAVYTTAAADSTPPNVTLVSPETQTGVDITTAIKFAANEAMDMNTITVTSTPSIGDKPNIVSIGYKDVTGSQYDYVYQIVPSDALALDTDYAITISGGKDLAGNSMTAATINFKTAATSNGVTGTGTTATAQTEVKAALGKWIDSMNSSDITLMSSMLTGDFEMSYSKEGTTCNQGSPCNYDLNKDGMLSYDEFIKFIQAWFNENDKIQGWTGDSSGVHLAGDVPSGAEIKVDESTGTAAFAFEMTYTNDDGTTYTSAGDNGVITVYLILKNVNGAWYLNSVSEKDNTGVIGVNIGGITAGNPSGEQASGTKTVTFNWTTVSGISSYAVVLMDNNDPSGSTGWVGIVDASNFGTSTSATFDYSTVSDFVATDGNLVLVGGGLDAPFSRELGTLKDGGSYTWLVIGFKTLTASSFTTGNVEPDSDIVAMSSGTTFSIPGTLTSGITVTPQSSSGTNLTYDSTSLYAWDADSTSSAKLYISTTSGRSEGKVYIYGNYYAEKAFVFTGGVATVDIDLFNGYNWIDVTDGVNWWYATYPKSNYIYTDSGASYNQLTVDSVTSGGTTISPDAYGYYNVNATSIVIKGKASASTVYIYNSTSTNYSTDSATVSSGAYTATVDIFSGYNWISIYDGYGNWAYVNIYNSSATGATYVDPISSLVVKDASNLAITPSTDGSYSVNTTLVTLSGSLKNQGNGYWYAWSDTKSFSGTLFRNTDGTFSFPIDVYYGYNYIDLYDANWNWKGVTIYNQNAESAQPNTITAIDGVQQIPATSGYYYYPPTGQLFTNCTVTIDGKSPGSGNKTVYLYLYNYSGTQSIYDYQTATADPSGQYQFNVNLGNGTNYIDVYDANWNWQGVQITTSGICSSQISAFTADIYVGTSTTPLSLTDGWYYNAGSASTVTIRGTGKADKTINIYVSGQYYDTYSTTILSDGTYTKDIKLYSGYNYISLSDGANWLYPTVYTTGTSTYTEPFKITSVTSSDGTVTSTDDYNYSGSATTITLSGTSTTDGTGYWYGGGGNGTFTVTGGTFSVTITLWYGSNWVDLYGPSGSWDGVYFYTTGGSNAPKKYVTITSPSHGTTQSGNISVTGTVDTVGFTPARVFAYVWDNNTYQSKYYSSDPLDQQNYGDLPLTYSSGTFSFSATVGTGNPTLIEVEACDANWMCRGQGVWVNNTYNYGDYFWKPGTKASSSNTKARAHKAEFLKKKILKKKTR